MYVERASFLILPTQIASNLRTSIFTYNERIVQTAFWSTYIFHLRWGFGVALWEIFTLGECVSSVDRPLVPLQFIKIFDRNMIM